MPSIQQLLVGTVLKFPDWLLLRVSGDALIIDPRTVLVEQEDALIETLQAALAAAEPAG